MAENDADGQITGNHNLAASALPKKQKYIWYTRCSYQTKCCWKTRWLRENDISEHNALTTARTCTPMSPHTKYWSAGGDWPTPLVFNGVLTRILIGQHSNCQFKNGGVDLYVVSSPVISRFNFLSISETSTTATIRHDEPRAQSQDCICEKSQNWFVICIIRTSELICPCLNPYRLSTGGSTLSYILQMHEHTGGFRSGDQVQIAERPLAWIVKHMLHGGEVRHYQGFFTCTKFMVWTCIHLCIHPLVGGQEYEERIFPAGWHAVTMLRDPVPRVQSLFWQHVWACAQPMYASPRCRNFRGSNYTTLFKLYYNSDPCVSFKLRHQCHRHPHSCMHSCAHKCTYTPAQINICTHSDHSSLPHSAIKGDGQPAVPLHEKRLHGARGCGEPVQARSSHGQVGGGRNRP